VAARCRAVESLGLKVMRDFWCEKRVLVTGHTGFKGSWLSAWLLDMGADVLGIGLEPDTDPSLFMQLELADRLDHRICDIRDAQKVAKIVDSFQPDIVLHLAAQPLVIRSYDYPLETWSTNVIGTANVLEAIRTVTGQCAAVMVTTDKVYENLEWEYGYRENDRLGGHDPYSASKAAAELVSASWRKSFFSKQGNIRVATARAGNVIGGGDWADNRIVPDIARALMTGEKVVVRNPAATRPWQHVLDPLFGYLKLAQFLFEGPTEGFADSYNFGPNPEAQRPVADLVEASLKVWPGEAEFGIPNPHAVHEAGLLSLNIERSAHHLDWRPIWGFEEAVTATMEWYRSAGETDNGAIQKLTSAQIRQFENAIP